MKRLAYFLVIILFFFSAHPTQGCTIVMVAKGKIVLAGNNEDWKNPKTKIWFIPSSEVLFRIAERQGVEKAVERYHKMRNEFRKIYRYDVSEQEINSLGYILLGEDKTEEAIAIFKLNVAEHPKSWNVYDSLGEAYMKKGEKELAIENYKKSLELNPNNMNGRDMLEKLGVKK